MLKAEKIKKNGKILAIILRSKKISNSTLEFVTPEDFPLQLGVHNRKKSEYIKAHEHAPISNLINMPVQEIIFLKKGKILVGLYHHKKYFKNVELTSDDIILLNTGHNIKFLENTQMIEIKQGPYRGKQHEKKALE